MAMRRLDGRTLHELLREWDPRGVGVADPAHLAQAVEVLIGVADCLAYAHSQIDRGICMA